MKSVGLLYLASTFHRKHETVPLVFVIASARPAVPAGNNRRPRQPPAGNNRHPRPPPGVGDPPPDTPGSNRRGCTMSTATDNRRRAATAGGGTLGAAADHVYRSCCMPKFTSTGAVKFKCRSGGDVATPE